VLCRDQSSDERPAARGNSAGWPHPAGPWWPAVATAVLVAAAAVGCGPDGPARHRVHGTVTYAGRPVPVGRIVFEPDVLKGNRGPQGFAVVEEGRFDTAVKQGRGTSGGPMVVTIDAFDTPGPGQAATPLVTNHQEHCDLPTADTELTFDLKAATGR